MARTIPGSTSSFASNNDSLLRVQGGRGRRAGFPVGVRFQGTSKNPSPALADMNGDGFLDIVAASTDGQIYVYTGRCAQRNFANARYSTFVDGSASESSPWWPTSMATVCPTS
jgi:hypothetical protein